MLHDTVTKVKGHIYRLPFAKFCLHILLRNCLLKHITEGNIHGRIEMTGRRRRSGRRKQLVDEVKETKG
jgi:hypothetical protein